MKCIHGHEPIKAPPGTGYACPTLMCECCGQVEPYFFIGNSGPPLGDKDLCAICSGTGVIQVKDLYPKPPPPKTLQERLADFKAAKSAKRRSGEL